MRSNTAVVSALAALCVVQAGLLATTWMGGPALAEEPSPFHVSSTPSPEKPVEKLLCRLFKIASDQPQFTVPDGRTEAGQWALDNEDKWRLHGVDFEMGTKANGYPQAWVQICLAER